ncbi:MAG TPA: AAA family ATPase [Rectinemataceae bacterium]|nr:AAA family ATPase [Rectinemataceae bacterium]
MALFFGKISAAKGPQGQLENGFYLAPRDCSWYNGIDVGDYAFVIGGGKVALWKAREWMEAGAENDGDRLYFDIVIRDLAVAMTAFTSLKFFKVTPDFLVFTWRSTGKAKKAFFPIELAEEFPEHTMTDPATYANPENYRRVVFTSSPEAMVGDRDIFVFESEVGSLSLHPSGFLAQTIIQDFTDNRPSIGLGQSQKDTTLRRFQATDGTRALGYEELPLLRFYDAFCCDYRRALISAVPDAKDDLELEDEASAELSRIKDMAEMLSILKRKKQLILQGAPGVGKTYATKELALRALGEGQLASRENINQKYAKAVADGRVIFCAFHQSMDYEDFVEGYKPAGAKDGTPIFELKPGPFKIICDLCLKDPARKPRVLIIDEINRGNLSKLLGELITALETDKRESEPGKTGETIAVRLTYSGSALTVPRNLFIIGTMNTADRSLGQIDYALRRRFAFFTLKSDKDALASFYSGNNSALREKALGLFETTMEFFKAEGRVHRDFDPEDILVGHSYFMAEDQDELGFKMRYELKPLLEEYRKDGILAINSESARKDYASLLEKLSRD